MWVRRVSAGRRVLRDGGDQIVRRPGRRCVRQAADRRGGRGHGAWFELLPRPSVGPRAGEDQLSKENRNHRTRRGRAALAQVLSAGPRDDLEGQLSNTSSLTRRGSKSE